MTYCVDKITEYVFVFVCVYMSVDEYMHTLEVCDLQHRL